MSLRTSVLSHWYLSWVHCRIHSPVCNIPGQCSTVIDLTFIDRSIVLSTIFHVNVRLQSKSIDGSIVLSTIFHVNVRLQSILSSLMDPLSYLQYSMSMFDCSLSWVHWWIHCPIYNIPCQCSTAVYPEFIDGSIVLSTIFHVNVRLQSILSTLTDPLSYLQYSMSMFDCSLF